MHSYHRFLDIQYTMWLISTSYMAREHESSTLWGHCRVHNVLWHQRRWFESPMWGSAWRPDAVGDVFSNYMGSTAKDTEVCWYCLSTHSAWKFPKSHWVNGTSIADIPAVCPSLQIMSVWPCTIYPGASTSQVQWWAEWPTFQGPWRLWCSPTPTGNLSESDMVHNGSQIHDDYLAHNSWWEVLDCWRHMGTSHWSSALLVGNRWYSCRYTIGVLIFW